MWLKQELHLENDVVALSALREDHFDDLLPFAINEPELWTYSLQSGAGKENFRSYFDAAIAGREAGHSYPFIVVDKRTEQVAGCTRFYDIQPTHQSLQLGYTWYGQQFQGTGLNKNCKLLLLEYAFDHLGMKRVEFRADNANARSISAMKSIGCTVEGVLRENCAKPDGSRRDSIILSILQSEWTAGLKANLKRTIEPSQI